jgi:hypothetical protein
MKTVRVVAEAETGMEIAYIEYGQEKRAFIERIDPDVPGFEIVTVENGIERHHDPEQVQYTGNRR